MKFVNLVTTERSEPGPVRNWCGVSAGSAAGRAHAGRATAASVTSESVAGGGGIPLSVSLSVSLSIISLSISRVAVYDGAEGRLIPVCRQPVAVHLVRVRARVRVRG